MEFQFKISLHIIELSFSSDVDIDSLLASHGGMNITNVLGDGNCLFRAVCICINGNDGTHNQLRNAAVDFIELNQGLFTDYFSENTDGDPFTVEEAIVRMRRDKEYCGDFALSALAQDCNLDI